MFLFKHLVLLASTISFIRLCAGRQLKDYKLDRMRRAALAASRQYGDGREVVETDTSGYKYLTNSTKPFRVESLPNLHYPVGEMYSGLIPISKNDTSRELFFVFKPAIDADAPQDEITIYLNGGPGASSLIAFWQENGPFTWQPGTFLPTPNPYSWANITNMLWVDQPVGTGFSTGKVTATNEDDIAADFVSWFKNFLQTFGIKNYKIYVTGESYAGRYVPYISSAMLNESNTEYYDLRGALVYDPVIGNFIYTQEAVVVYPFLEENNAMLSLNSSFLAQLAKAHESCGYAALIDKYFTFPPPSNQPAVLYDAAKDPSCALWDLANDALLEINPCFNIYAVNQQCPLPWDVLAFPTELFYLPEFATVYFNRTDVKKAIHAPVDADWSVIAERPVFIGAGGPEGYDDTSPDPIQHVLPQVIEATNRVLVANGDLDMIIITNGTLLSIQNMTWNGKLGFQSRPSTPIYVTTPDLAYESVYESNFGLGYGKTLSDLPQGTMGIQHFERGLMWAETYLSGHEGPQYQPRVSLQHIKWLLGRIETL